jgi:hypothetical protein
MKTFHMLAVCALLGAGATSAAAQGVTLEFQDGKVRLHAQNVTISQILAEWSRRGRTTIVNGERVPGPPVTLELENVSEQQALDTVLRSVSGYLVAARETAIEGASSFDRIYILPTSSRPSNAATAVAPQQPVLQVQDDLDDDEPLPNGPRGLQGPPGSRLPRDTNQPANARPPISLEDDAPPDNADKPQPTPTNPFGVAPGTARPGVVTPGPPPPAGRPNQ